jgi:LPXTG-motif cell wall-anchored protein
MSIYIKRVYRLSLGILCATLFSVALLHADQWSKSTKFTFKEPVQVPGQVLPAGTYVFRLMNSSSERHVVQIYDETDQHLIATVMAINNYRLEPKGSTVVLFSERAGGTPDAIKEWFYPGDNFGQEFVYPKGEELQTAQATITTTPMAQPAPVEVPVETAPAPAESAAPAEEAPQASQPEPEQQAPAAAAPAPAPEEPAPAPAEPESLPKTGSELPLIGLLGFSSLGSGLLLRILRR